MRLNSTAPRVVYTCTIRWWRGMKTRLPQLEIILDNTENQSRHSNLKFWWNQRRSMWGLGFDWEENHPPRQPNLDYCLPWWNTLTGHHFYSKPRTTVVKFTNFKDQELAMTARLPHEKIHTMMQLHGEYQNRLKKWQSLIGHLSFAPQVIRRGPQAPFHPQIHWLHQVHSQLSPFC